LILGKILHFLRVASLGLDSIAGRLDRMDRNIARIADKVDVEAGTFTIKGMIKNPSPTSEAGIPDADLAFVTVDVEFSQAMYMAVHPNNKPKIMEIMENDKMDRLLTVLNAHKELNTLAIWAEEFLERTDIELNEKKELMVSDIRESLLTAENSIPEMHKVSAEKLIAKNKAIDVALKVLGGKIAEVDKMKAELRKEIKERVPPKTKIFRPKR